MPPPDRREFLTLAAGAAALAAAPASPRKPAMTPVIDTHVHLWDLKQFKLPWLKPDMPFARNFLIDDYRAATRGANLVKAVYMEVDVAADRKQAEADWIRGVCKKGDTPIIAAVVGGDPAGDGFADYARQFKGDPYVKGIRQVLHVPETPSGYCLKDKFVAGVKLLGELGLTYDLCIRPADLTPSAKLVGQCPGTRFVLDHCGNADPWKDISAWKRDLVEMAKHPNVICKVSGILFTAPKGWKAAELAPVVNHVLDTFGPDRVIYASDWPVCTNGGTWQQWYEAVGEIVASRPAAEQKKLFSGNAAKFYGL
jgi:L-fuconolactonase